jgi:Zn-dependent protease
MSNYRHINPHYQRGIKTSQKELLDLAKAWLILGLAFAIVMHGFSFDIGLLIAFGIALLTIGVGFLFHELAHKFFAQKYGCFAEFRSFDKMLFLALIMSFFGFIFAAPGAVMIQGHLTRKQRGVVSAAGPAMNMAIALAFFAMLFTHVPYLQVIGHFGFIINSWLAAFNLIPFAMFDGRKIYTWSKPVYFAMVAIGVGLIVLTNLMMMGKLPFLL